MKKLNVFIALLLCLTISGVFAVWTYSGSVDIIDQNKEVFVELTDAVDAGADGTFTMEYNFTLAVDQANDDHLAKLVFVTTDGADPYLTITFKPSAGATSEIKQNGVDAELYFKTSTTMEVPVDATGHYDPTGTKKPIFAFENESDGDFIPNVDWGTPNGDGLFTVTYDADQLAEMIQLNGNIYLDSKPNHTAFRQLMNGNITICLTNGIIDNEDAG